MKPIGVSHTVTLGMNVKGDTGLENFRGKRNQVEKRKLFSVFYLQRCIIRSHSSKDNLGIVLVVLKFDSCIDTSTLSTDLKLIEYMN